MGDMDHLASGTSYLTREQRRLLGGWHDIVDDIGRLSESFLALPDGCGCGGGESHLGGSCGCGQCEPLLVQLRWEIDLLTVDTWRFFPVVRMLLESHHIDAAVAEETDIERHIAAIIRSFDRLVLAAEEVPDGCRVSQLHTLKTVAADLRTDVQRFEKAL